MKTVKRKVFTEVRDQVWSQICIQVAIQVDIQVGRYGVGIPVGNQVKGHVRDKLNEVS